MVKKQEYAKENHNHWGLYAFILLVYFIMMGFTIWQGIMITDLQDEVSTMPHYECWNETDSSLKDSCWDNCYEISHYNVSFFCDLSIPGDCERNELAGFRASEDYELCVRGRGCLDIDSEVREVCQLNRHDAFLGTGEQNG